MIETVETVGPYYEKKFLFPTEERERLLLYLSHYFIRPEQYSVGENRTLYYDTNDLADYYDGLSGQRYRKKVRIRRYSSNSNLGSSHAFEIKIKDGQTVNKRRIRFRLDGLDLFQPLSILAEQVPMIRSLFDQYDCELSKYFPRLEIKYTRWRLLCPGSNVRLNLDTGLKSIRYWMDKDVSVPYEKSINALLVEVKGDNNPGLPYPIDQIGGKGIALSKYCFLVSQFLDQTNIEAYLDSTADSGRLAGWR